MITRRQFSQQIGMMVGGIAMGSTLGPAFAQSNKSAKEAGFWMPEESERHHRTFMQWPVSRTVYPDAYFLNMIQDTIADVANAISEFEPVVMLMASSHIEAAYKKLSDKVEVWDIPTEDLWCRDSGPAFVVNDHGELAISHLNFNGWGNRQVHSKDGRIATKIAKLMLLRSFNNGVVGEAGGLETDGNGTLIAHSSSWVNENRNSGSQTKIEQQLLDAYGAEKMIWAPGIKNMDITDYHIDSLARFVRPGLVVMQLPDEIIAGDPWSQAAYETYDIIRHSKDAMGNNIEVKVIPEPVNIRMQSKDFVASYANYYVCNGAVICAQFGDKDADQEAIHILEELYPGREIVSLNVDPLGEVGGGIHCATQQQPEV